MHPPLPPSRPPVSRLPWRFGLVLLVALTCVSAAWGADFPRGPGFYFSPVKLAVLFVAFLSWVALSAWLDKDATTCKLDADRWNGMMLGLGLTGLFVLWILPTFWFGLVLAALIVLGGFGGYAHIRNQNVAAADRILTPDHLRALAAHYLRLRVKAGGGGGPGVPVRILARGTNAREGDVARVERVQTSKGYKGALEMLYEAIQRRATDIHMEPAAEQMTVRFRIDGVMVNVTPFSRMMGDAVVNIFKVICNLDITEKRKPQDGSFSAQVEDRVVDFRVATAGSVAGEKMVMRILDAAQALVSLEQVGMPEDLREKVRELATQPHGMFLVCGPTGSGKSTTLYACLHEVDRYSLNVITVENPVEYHLDNVTQIEINPKAGKTFAGELRSILRQDPDVIMVGEIRDKETAEIACQAAQTGHMVFSTVHANDTVTALARLIDLGVQPFMVASALSAVLGQRLVRKLCLHCRTRFKPSAETLKRINADPDLVRFLYRAAEPQERDEDDEEGEGPCEECGGTGYYKRTGIFELLVINDKIRELMRENPDLQAIRQEAVANGLHTLFEDGSRLVVAGQTSLQELLRVSK